MGGDQWQVEGCACSPSGVHEDGAGEGFASGSHGDVGSVM